MRILHLSNDLYPHVTGGTEIFVQQLIEAQQALSPGDAIRWAAHSHTSLPSPPDSAPKLAPGQVLLPPVELSGRRATVGQRAAAVPGFAELLAEFRPDLVHLHSLSPRCGLSHVRLARQAGARLLLTVHAPGFTCLQGSLLYHRRQPCDGLIRDRRCTECRLVNGRLPLPLAHAVAWQTGWPLSPERPGRLAHLLTSRQITAAFRESWAELVGLMDGIHALAAWSQEVLRLNGVPDHKLSLIRTGGPDPLPPRRRRPLQDGVLRLVYWGRCAEVKGLHLLIEAIRSLPVELPLQLDFWGPYWNDDYGRGLQRLIAGDRRFRLQGPLPKQELLHRLQAYDLAVVPSTWLETGPLTVLEAFAVGLPVAGSDLGGIRELLEGVPGCWRVPLDPAAWARLLTALLADPRPLATAPPAPRSFRAVAEELQVFHAELGNGALP